MSAASDPDRRSLLTVAGATLKFRYDGEMDFGRDVVDALSSFEIADGEVMRAGDEEKGKLGYLEAMPEGRPLALQVAMFPRRWVRRPSG